MKRTVFTLCSLLVIISLLRIKEYSTNRKYQIGLILMMAGVVISLMKVMVNIPSAFLV